MQQIFISFVNICPSPSDFDTLQLKNTDANRQITMMRISPVALNNLCFPYTWWLFKPFQSHGPIF